jgi:hypothetical protein
VNRPDLDEPIPLDDISFFNPDINDCPYHSCRTMRYDAPLWFLDETDLSIAPNYFLRALKSLHIGFRAV